MKTILERIKKRVKINPDTGCWEWQGGKDKDGYGKTKAHGKHRRVHCVVFEETYLGKLNGLMCLHKCDNPPCCNPEHLFVGDAKDNIQDCLQKGRFPIGNESFARLHPDRLARGDKNGSRVHIEKMPRGEKNTRAKLKETDVLEIRQLYDSGVTTGQIGPMFGIAASTAVRIVRRIIWKHVA